MTTTAKKGLSDDDMNAVLKVVHQNKVNKLFNDVNFIAYSFSEENWYKPGSKKQTFSSLRWSGRFPELSRTGVCTSSSSSGPSETSIYMRNENLTCTDQKWNELRTNLLAMLNESRMFSWSECYSSPTNSIALIREQARELSAKEERENVENEVKYATEALDRATKGRLKAKTQKEIKDADYYLESAKERLTKAKAVKAKMDAPDSDDDEDDDGDQVMKVESKTESKIETKTKAESNTKVETSGNKVAEKLVSSSSDLNDMIF